MSSSDRTALPTRRARLALVRASERIDAIPVRGYAVLDARQPHTLTPHTPPAPKAAPSHHGRFVQKPPRKAPRPRLVSKWRSRARRNGAEHKEVFFSPNPFAIADGWPLQIS